MVAPFCKTTEEVKANIKRIEHNTDGGIKGSGTGAPTGISGGSGGNYNSGKAEGVPPTKKGQDWA